MLRAQGQHYSTGLRPPKRLAAYHDSTRTLTIIWAFSY